MFFNKSVRVSTIALACCSVTILAQAAEKTIQRSALPAAVEKTVQQQSKGASIKGFTTEKENGKVAYEAAMIVDGHTRDVEIAADGSINEVEEQVTLESLPAEVQTALKAKAAGAKITKVESLMKHDTLVAYEAATLRGGKKGEIQVGPDGKNLAHPE